MTAAEWIALAGLALGILVALGTFAVWISGQLGRLAGAISDLAIALRAEAKMERHAFRNEMTALVGGECSDLNEALERLRGVVEGLSQRVTRLEARAGGD